MKPTRSIYLDHGATSFPKAPGVVEAMARFLEHDAGNPGRGGHRLTVAASRAIEGAREDLANFLGADPERTLLGSGATREVFAAPGAYPVLLSVDEKRHLPQFAEK